MADGGKGRTLEASGGMNEFYRAASREFEYSNRLRSSWEPSNEERLAWLGSMICDLRILHAAHLHVQHNMESAIQTRRLLGDFLNEMGKLIEQRKADKAKGEST